jgi:hypothetical protein
MAREYGFEPQRSVLETDMLPLTSLPDNTGALYEIRTRVLTVKG